MMKLELNVAQRLEALARHQGPILSVYLGDAGLQPPKAGELITQFHSLVHTNLTKRVQRRHAEEVAKIAHFLGEYDGGTSRSLVFFAAPDIWDVFKFEFYLPPTLVLGPAAIQPLADAVAEHSKYLVILADRARARMFKVEQGAITEQAQILNGHVPQKVRAIRGDGQTGRDDKILRHIEEHLHAHLTLVAKAATKFAAGNDFHFVILGGHREMLEKLRKLLPDELQSKVAAEFVTQTDITPADVLHKTKPIAALASLR